MAAAMAISEPLSAHTLRPPSSAVAFLWSIFDLGGGRWIGNPHNDQTWYRCGPFLGAAYALWEGAGGATPASRYFRPSGGAEFDNLGIYQLVKRRCPFIIACDAGSDPTLSFEDLGSAIRRCRTELGVDIEIDLGALSRKSPLLPLPQFTTPMRIRV